MVPRKKRKRYRVRARAISKRLGVTVNLNNWIMVWELLDRYGLKDKQENLCSK